MKNPEKYNFVQIGSLWLAYPKGDYTFQVATSITLKFAMNVLLAADKRINKQLKRLTPELSSKEKESK